MCIFCKIINKEILSYVIYEDEYTLAFLDIEANSYGHTLIVPKSHVINMLDIDETTFRRVSDTLYKVINRYKEVLNLESLNVLNNSGEYASQTVFHLHYHVIPRYNNEIKNIMEEKKYNFDDICKLLKFN